MTSRHFAHGDDRGGEPQPGHYLIRLVRGGPRIPATIAYDPLARLWSATVDGAPAGAPTMDYDSHEELMRIWHYGHRSSAAEHAYLYQMKGWAETHQPGHPLLHPRRPVDVAALPPVLP